MTVEPSDEAIVAEALADKERFALLISRYEAKLSRYLERLGLSVAEDREDVLQNAFIKAYRNLQSFDPSLTFSSWMYRIAHNEAMSFFRTRRARPSVVLDEAGQALLAEMRDEGADTAARAEARLTAASLGRALAELAPQYRDVLTLRFFEERSYSDISDILEVPVGTVSTLIHRAKKELRAKLSSQFTHA